jgi:uncharacterized tellurite resistance protein B-like protein
MEEKPASGELVNPKRCHSMAEQDNPGRTATTGRQANLSSIPSTLNFKEIIKGRFISNALLHSHIMNMTEYNSYQIAMCKIYYLTIYADGDLTEDEYETGKRILKDEGITIDSLDIDVLRQFQTLVRQDQIKDCEHSLRELTRNEQVKCIAWMCLLAESDWVMSKPESAIYEYFLKALDLSLSEISLEQSEMNKKSILGDNKG